ncbi:MAG: transglycosylase domain-containing protein [Rhodospirillaceae bacterium]|nr:transglycosylase domain-containing protein [Rhodospirillaceae bacterium]
MCELLVAGEDHRIALHPGVDPLALCRAAWRTYGRGRVEGGSTVAMQFVRVLTGRFENSWRRKMREMALAVVATRYAHRSELASLYLLVGYYGWRMNGFGQACRRLGIDPKTCSLRDSAMLIARLKYPQPRDCSVTRWAQIVGRGEYLVGRLESGGQ